MWCSIISSSPTSIAPRECIWVAQIFYRCWCSSTLSQVGALLCAVVMTHTVNSTMVFPNIVCAVVFWGNFLQKQINSHEMQNIYVRKIWLICVISRDKYLKTILVQKLNLHENAKLDIDLKIYFPYCLIFTNYVCWLWDFLTHVLFVIDLYEKWKYSPFYRTIMCIAHWSKHMLMS